MTKKSKERVTQAQMVIAIVHRTPECILQDVCDVLDLPSSSAGNLLRRLHAAGKLRRLHNGTQYVYRVHAGTEIPNVKLPEPAIKTTPEKAQLVNDAIILARQLEEKGLYRRAATTYTAILGMVSNASELWNIARLRNRCLRNAARC